MTFPDLPNSSEEYVLFGLLTYEQQERAYATRFNDRTITHVLTGCKPGCKHRLPDTVRIETWRHSVFKNNYKVTIIDPNCDQEEALALRRKEIFDRADKESWAAFEKYTAWHAKMRAKRETWDKIVAECESCPYFED